MDVESVKRGVMPIYSAISMEENCPPSVMMVVNNPSTSPTDSPASSSAMRLASAES